VSEYFLYTSTPLRLLISTVCRSLHPSHLDLLESGRGTSLATLDLECAKCPRMASQFFGFPPRCEGSASAALVVLVCWQDVAVAVVLGGKWAGGSGKQASRQASKQSKHRAREDLSVPRRYGCPSATERGVFG